MNNIFVEFLPPWVETGLQPAFYDKESGTVLQQTARMYARVNMLIRMFNKLSKQTKETVEEYINKFNELHNYVQDYFDNLDVQEEINNKLDQMAESGQLTDIIGAYLQSSAFWGFKSIQEVINSANLVEGSYLQTTGFHSNNDGGGASYVIIQKETPTAFGNIAINDQYDAKLIYDNEINVKQFGAYGDDTHDDTEVFNKCAVLAKELNLPLVVPDGVYLLDNEVVLKDINVKCEGTLNNTQPLILGGKSQGSTRTNVEIYKANKVQIEGAKRCYFNIVYSDEIKMYSDGNSVDNKSQAYNIIDGVEVGEFIIDSINNGWINDNEINIRRCMRKILITSDGYRHNNNHFNNICIEGSDKIIQIDYGHDNYIYYRGEDNPQIILSDDVEYCWHNVIKRQYTSNPYSLMRVDQSDDIQYNRYNGSNLIGVEGMSDFFRNTLVRLNLRNVNKFSTNNLNKLDGIITGRWSTFFESNVFELTTPIHIIINSDVRCLRPRIYLYDENGNPVQGNVGSSLGLRWDATNNYYGVGVDVGINGYITIFPSSVVKTCKIMIQTGNGSQFKFVNIDVLSAFNVTNNIYNTVEMGKKYSNTDPRTESNKDWDRGDIVLKSSPSNGVLGWYCTSGGNPGDWYQIPYVTS